MTTRKTNGCVLSLHVYLWFCSDWQGLRCRGGRGQKQKLSLVTQGEPTPHLSRSPTLDGEVEEGQGWALAVRLIPSSGNTDVEGMVSTAFATMQSS